VCATGGIALPRNERRSNPDARAYLSTLLYLPLYSTYLSTLLYLPLYSTLPTSLLYLPCYPSTHQVAIYGDRGADPLLVYSQVVLSLQLPFAVIPLGELAPKP